MSNDHLVETHAAPVPETQATAQPLDVSQVPTAHPEDAPVDAMANLAIAQPQAELHRACAEGRQEDVRAILARGVDSLETLDLSTGCTPIVLAIQNGQVEIVRDLLSAGAIVPPPGLTMDPVMLSVLYPQPVFGVPPPFAQMGPPQFYHHHQQAFFQPSGGAPFPPRKDSTPPNGNGPANLPPAEVAKTIPCRNFPNCKYGASCIFFHPRPQTAFFQPQYAPYHAQAFYPGSQDFAQQKVNGSADPTAQQQDQAATDGSAAPADSNGATPDPSTATKHDSIPAQQPAPGAAGAPTHVPSALSPTFVPGAIPVEVPNGSHFVGSPPAGYVPLGVPIPHDAAFFATSPHHFPSFIPNGFPGGPGRRQSFGQPFSAGGPPPKPYHGKKPSFSGGPKPWGSGGRPGSHLGGWKDGNLPHCAFFRDGKCRNGEFCKFPHIDADGNDVRHPDVVRGILPPMPTRPPPRHLRMMGGGSYDPALRHQQQLHYMQQKAAAASSTVAESPAAETEATTTDAESPATAATTPATTEENVENGVSTPSSDKDGSAPAAAPASATLPPKPSGSIPPVVRSASQPGVARVQANGARSHSPLPNGVRRGARYANGHANGHNSRSSSSNGIPNGEGRKPALPPQRVPRADEFPALGGLSGGVTPTERREPSWGKTAAQVLSEPAPVKPIPATAPASVKADNEEEPETKPVVEKSEEVVTMDSDSEHDAVIVSVSTTPNPEVAAKSKLAAATISFASVAGNVPAVELPVVALKA